MAKNTNRDYLIIVDVKSSAIREFNKLEFYINDKESHNIFVQLVVKESHDIINKYAPIDDPNLYELAMNIVKPTNEHKKIIGKLISLEDGLYEFRLPQDCCDKVGTYKCELETKYNSRITNSNKIKYRIKKSVLNDLDDIVDAPGYPIVIQLLDKLSDIEQYEEDRRANELARQLAENQRKVKYNKLVSDMTDSIEAIDNKVIDIDNRITAKEQAVDTLIADTKADIDNYKVAKDQEIDDYKSSKDTEINEAIARQDNKINDAITNQDNKIADAITSQNNRISVVENNDNVQNNRLDAIEVKDIVHESRMADIENKNNEQDNILDAIEVKNTEQDSRLDAIEVKNQQQDDRLLDIEKVNKRQDMDLKMLFAESKNNMIDVTEEGNSIYLQNSTVGYTLIDEIQGNTMVNCNKEPDKEIILNGNINTQGYSNVTLTEGVDGGKVDVALEGNTMVNVCDQKDPVAITKSYTVETGNHVALQGEYDGKCRPVVTGNTLVNLAGLSNFVEWATTYGDTVVCPIFHNDSIKRSVKVYANKTYTIIRKGVWENIKYRFYDSNNSYVAGNMESLTYTPSQDGYLQIYFEGTLDDRNEQNIKDIMILEGDYTNKPIPEYFEGLQSSFEDKVVTQEMVDNGEELPENLGKYKVDYVVTGKNKFDGKWQKNEGVYGVYYYGKGTYAISIHEKDLSLLNSSYALGHSKLDGSNIVWMFSNNQIYKNNVTITDCKLVFRMPTEEGLNLLTSALNIQIEEGSTATSYEPYKEYKKTFYLNSPLLEGDTIEQQGNNVVHIHRSELRAYETDDELTLPTDMTNTLVAKATPQYEVISTNDTILCDSYVNGHLDVDSVVPIEKVDFLPFKEELTYLYPSTQYAVQFVSDAVSKVDITLGGAKLLNQNVVVGTNKYTITTPSELIDNNLVLNGEGFNASNIVVTKATDQDFGYFEGMKSVGECEELEVRSNNKNLINTIDSIQECFIKKGTQVTVSYDNRNITNTPRIEYYSKDMRLISWWSIYLKNPEKTRVYRTFVIEEDCYFIKFISNGNSDINNVMLCIGTSIDYIPHQSNTQTLTHEPLRAVGDTKDKYVLIDGKWYIERNCGEYTIPQDTVWTKTSMASDSNYIRYMFRMNNILTKNLNASNYKNFAISDLLPFGYSNAWGSCNRNEFQIINNSAELYLQVNLSTEEAVASLVNGAKLVYKLDSPTYEPIHYNPFEVYLDTTHISNNSTIPCNMTIKNTGYNCLLKPSTTYTVSSNLGLNVVTTPSTLTEDCLRFYDTDTSTVTTMKDVTILEGDYITGKPLPSHFSGIESAFEQAYDEEKGKYKVKIRVQNEDASKENYIEFYIDEPLRGIGDVKDKVYVKDDKVVVERNCGSVTFDGSERWEHGYRGEYDNKTMIFAYRQTGVVTTSGANKVVCDKFPYTARTIQSANYEMVQLLGFTNYGYIDIRIHKSKLQTQDVAGFKQWLQQNPTTVVYQLAEPIYEEIEYNDVKLFIESFKNSTLFYGSNIPVTSKIWYSYSIPLVDTVAQTASISDEQDSMIIDLATQVAILEMMTL